MRDHRPNHLGFHSSILRPTAPCFVPRLPISPPITASSSHNQTLTKLSSLRSHEGPHVADTARNSTLPSTSCTEKPSSHTRAHSMVEFFNAPNLCKCPIRCADRLAHPWIAKLPTLLSWPLPTTTPFVPSPLPYESLVGHRNRPICDTDDGPPLRRNGLRLPPGLSMSKEERERVREWLVAIPDTFRSVDLEWVNHMESMSIAHVESTEEGAPWGSATQRRRQRPGREEVEGLWKAWGKTVLRQRSGISGF